MQRFNGKLCLLFAAISAAMSANAETVNQNSPLVFDKVVVTATRTENSVADAPASIAIITAEQIQEQPGLALNDLVEQAAGVESRKQSGRSGRETISIRGMDSSYTLIMVNGRKMNSSNAVVRGNDFDLSTLPKDSIERIEIIRGPMSALYGSEALGGVVNIITRLPANEWHSTFNMDGSSPFDGNGGEESMLGLNTGGAVIDDELYLNLSVNQSQRESRTPWAKMPSTIDKTTMLTPTALEERDTLSLSGTLNWFIDDVHSLDLDVNYSDDNREGVNRTTKGGQPTRQDVTRHNVALTHTAEWEIGESQLRYYREEVEIAERDFEKHRTDSVTETTNTIDGSFSTELSEHRLTVGGEVRKSELDNKRDLANVGGAEVTQKALYAQDEWSLADDWTLTYGARADNHENFGTEISPRAYLVHNMTDNLTIKGGVGTAFKAPSLLQLNEDYILSSCKGNCKIKGNPDLQPETSTSYELAANYRQDTWEAEVAVFRNDIENLIERTVPDVPLEEIPVGAVYTYENIKEARVQGIEIGGRVALTDDIALSGDATYTDAHDETTGERLYDRPRQTASVKLSWQATDKLNTFVQNTYTGQQKLSSDVELAGYSLLDVGMTYQMFENTRIRAGVTNLGNESLPEDASKLGYSEDPRTVYMGLSYNF
ncbi:TonB-dependent receptor domain-containing protein [Parendozoicomonas haliclonae]|uniref:Colicin I receptor n=1 Tax=Parendozoicomonas haliclonae TaxID=1960125 RepID=A0A1X7AKV3_9GAMM|nr:TonB-dependent receptor [Parendozoicomonas haliclonae]SMA47643.1 Colicin I receptor precursor [Parendozoicomonas haliclonae]